MKSNFNGVVRFFKESFQATLKYVFTNPTAETVELVKRPTEGQWFKVDPRTIDRSLFFSDRFGYKQHELQRRIQRAFKRLDENPKKYGRSFETFIPPKTWNTVTAKELRKIARKIGYDLVAETEWAFLLAQIIANDNGSDKIWSEVCDKPGTTRFHSLIAYDVSPMVAPYTFVGGSLESKSTNSESTAGNNCFDISSLCSTVPLVKRYLYRFKLLTLLVNRFKLPARTANYIGKPF